MQRPWGWACIWGLALGVLFFSSYNTVNSFTAQRSDVGAYVLAWERHIPFLAWTIVPYWSIDFLYGIALFASRSKAELFRLGKRLLAAQVICISGFLLWPLRFTFERPHSDGLFGALFDALAGFDLPYNQAPSLHICLLVVLWRHYSDLAGQRAWRWLSHVWFALIGVSVLTTWQHHSIDLLTGLWAGALCLLLVPDQAARWRWLGDQPQRLRLGVLYGAGALLAAAAGAMLFPAVTAWLFYWLAAALALVGAIYLAGEPAHFGKQGKRMPWRSWMALGPYLLAARLNAWLWTRKLPVGTVVDEGVFLGRQPDAAHLQAHGVQTVIDLCAELPFRAAVAAHASHPQLDLLPPDAESLAHVAQAIDTTRQQGPVWVCCALGMSRSAAAVVAWLIRHRQHTLEQALARVRAARPQVVLSAAALAALATLEAQP
ncbi:phosphatase PAP2/dual specificity phosphatase family protein [Viridibacterium curvum]|uniref:Phosphatase PAP2/dual specificity phosphatase family protein n=1 Tax=Viridibacterium curvum TaxID=1101404 RepID=A0ABP9QRW2_9RHOO